MPSLADATTTLLSMLLQGEQDPAIALAQRWRDALIDDHRATQDAGTATLHRWALARDLLAVAVVLPPSLVQAFARGIAGNDSEPARAAVMRYRATNTSSARDLRLHIQKRTPSLYAFVGPAFDERVMPDLPPGSGKSQLRWSYLAILILVGAARLGGTCESQRATRLRQEPSLPLSQPLPPDVIERLHRHDDWPLPGPPPAPSLEDLELGSGAQP
jgi:hypothetical protein